VRAFAAGRTSTPNLEAEPRPLYGWDIESSAVESYDLEDGETVSQWSCPCGASGTDYDNIGDALTAARDHWRESLRAAIEAA
jgi:hypothetical protein